jgi:hypothetical protein
VTGRTGDKSYKEESWITQWSTQGPIYLLPRLHAKIDQHYPGTKLSISARAGFALACLRDLAPNGRGTRTLP